MTNSGDAQCTAVDPIPPLRMLLWCGYCQMQRKHRCSPNVWGTSRKAAQRSLTWIWNEPRSLHIGRSGWPLQSVRTKSWFFYVFLSFFVHFLSFFVLSGFMFRGSELGSKQSMFCIAFDVSFLILFCSRPAASLLTVSRCYAEQRSEGSVMRWCFLNTQPAILIFPMHFTDLNLVFQQWTCDLCSLCFLFPRVLCSWPDTRKCHLNAQGSLHVCYSIPRLPEL